MDIKKANEIIENDRAAREEARRAEAAKERHYRVYRVTPITSLFHRLPFKDVYSGRSYGGKGKADVWLYLYFLDCRADEVEQALKEADAGGIGVCVKSRWTTYLVERLS